MDTNTIFHTKYSELLPLYEKVRRYIILAEQYTDNFDVAPVNELRMAFDHIFRCVNQDEEKIKEEFENASRHILRAGYDSAEICSMTIYEQISDLLKPYSLALITLAIPNYYSEIRVKLNAVYYKKIVDARYGKKYKKNHTKKEEEFYEYDKIVNELDEIYGIVLKSIPNLEIAKKEGRKIDRKQLYINIIIAALFAALGLLLNCNKIKTVFSKTSEKVYFQNNLKDTIP